METRLPKDLVPCFFNDTSSTYDKISNYATFGKDKYWKEKIIEKIRNANSILDLACGTGILTRKIALNFPNSTIIGVDITKSYLDVAKKNSSSYSNISFIHQDAEKLDMEQRFDCICSSYIPKYCNAETLIDKCIQHLNPYGKIILHDFVYPKNFPINYLWNLYFPLLQLTGYFIPSWKEAFKKLPYIIKTTNWVDDFTYHFEKNGFEVKFESLTWNTSGILEAQKQ